MTNLLSLISALHVYNQTLDSASWIYMMLMVLCFLIIDPNNESQRHSSPFDSLKFKEKVAIIDIGFWVFMYCICKFFEYHPQAFTTRKCLGTVSLVWSSFFFFLKISGVKFKEIVVITICVIGPMVHIYCALVWWYWGLSVSVWPMLYKYSSCVTVPMEIFVFCLIQHIMNCLGAIFWFLLLTFLEASMQICFRE